jgi:hypothetical protein
LRWLLVLLAACGDNLPSLPPVPVLDAARFPAVANPALDLVIVVEDSPGTIDFQLDFANNVPALFDVLAQLDAVPSLHIGVATSDMGTTGSLSPTPAPGIGEGEGACSGAGKDGVFRRVGLHAGETFLIDEPAPDGTRTVNTDFTVSEELGMLVYAGPSGCGFEQHLAAMRRALTNPANGGFLRPEANLAIVILADEDDCSVRDPAFFGSDPSLGALQSFRCTQFGLACDQPLDTVGAKTSCRSDPSSRYIDDVQTFVDFVAGLKPDPRQILTAAMVGPPDVSVELRAPPGGGTPIPALAHSCLWNGTEGINVADPGVRHIQFAEAFGGPFAAICQQDQTPQLTQLGHAIKRLVGDPCLPDGATACTAVDELPDGTFVDVGVTVAPDPRACPDTGQHLRATTDATAGYVHVRC